MVYFTICGIILSFSATLSILLKKRIEQVIPIAIVEIVLIIFLAGIFDNLSLGVSIVKILTIFQLIFIIVSIIKTDKENKVKEIIKNITTPRISSLYSFIYN